MKITDYAPRAAALDAYLMGRRNLVGAEIGSDVGAHAEALLTYCDIQHLTLVDIWGKDYYRGYCEGRLSRFLSKLSFIHKDAVIAVTSFEDESLDFIYFDQQHDYDSVRGDLILYWPKLKRGGIASYRNYADSNTELKKAIDEFVERNAIKTNFERYHNEIILFK